MPAAAESPLAVRPEWLSMEQAAEMMGFSYFWLSRNWRQLGLHPSSPRPGSRARRMFEAREVHEFMQRQKFSYRGRPRKGA